MTTSIDSDTEDIAAIYLEAVERTKRQGYNPDAEGEDAFKFISARIANMEIIKSISNRWIPKLKFVCLFIYSINTTRIRADLI